MIRWAKWSGFLLLVTASLGLLVACGDNDGGVVPVDSGATHDTGPEFFIVENNDASGHSLLFSILCSDLRDGKSHTYVVVSGDHNHTLYLSAEQMAQIDNGATVRLEFTEGHAHVINVAKPAGACQ